VLLQKKTTARIWPSGQSSGLAHWRSRFNPGRDSLYTSGCTPQCFESASAEILRCIKTLIYFIIYNNLPRNAAICPGGSIEASAIVVAIIIPVLSFVVQNALVQTTCTVNRHMNY
jgi:hypothetical protein